MKFDINNEDVGTDCHAWHAIRVFDAEGNVLERVTHFDTETLLCTFGKRRQVVATGFCFCPTYEHSYNELLRFLPAGLCSFIVRNLINKQGEFLDTEGQKKRTLEFIKRYLEEVSKGQLERRLCKNTQCPMCYPAALYKTKTHG